MLVRLVTSGGTSLFAVLAGAGITVAGAVNTTTITGDIGSFATTSITGLENVVLSGVNHAGDAVTQQGKLDLGLAYADAAGRLPTVTFPPIAELGGMILGSGVYNDPSSFFDHGNPDLGRRRRPGCGLDFPERVDSDHGIGQQHFADWFRQGQQCFLAGGQFGNSRHELPFRRLDPGIGLHRAQYRCLIERTGIGKDWCCDL